MAKDASTRVVIVHHMVMVPIQIQIKAHALRLATQFSVAKLAKNSVNLQSDVLVTARHAPLQTQKIRRLAKNLKNITAGTMIVHQGHF